MPRLDRLVGARVRRVDAPSGDLVAVTLARPGGRKEVLVLSTGPHVGAGLVDERPRGAPAEGFARTLRREIGNATVRDSARIAGDGGTASVRVGLDRGDAPRSLVLDATAGDVWLLNERGAVIGSQRGGADHGPRRGEVHPLASVPGPAPSLDDLRTAGPRLLADRNRDAIERQRVELRRRLKRTRDRLARKCRAIEGDRARAAEAAPLRHDASLLLAHLHRTGPRDREVTVTDWGADPPVQRTLPIDPRLGPKAQADAWYHRAGRLERGAIIAEERLAHTKAELDEVDRLLGRVHAATTAPELEALEQDASTHESVRRRPTESTGKLAEPPSRRTYRTFAGSGDRPIRVGRSGADNDVLTLHHARPHDLWLHARGQAGAHVVVPLDRGEACPPDLLVDAATLAAHFSQARGEPVVEVTHTPRRFVRKPKKAGPGSVTVDREKVIAVRLERERLARLLASER